MSSALDPAKLKVVELRAELSKRGLDSKGNKPALVKRLKEALEEELKEELPDTSIADTSTEDLDTSQTQDQLDTEDLKVPDEEIEKNEPPISEQEETPDSKPETETFVNEQEKMEVEEEPPEAPPAAQEMEESEHEKSEEVTDTQEIPEKIQEKSESGFESNENGKQDEQFSEPRPAEIAPQEQKNENEVAETKVDKDVESKGEKRRRTSTSPDRSQRRRSKSPIKEDEPPIEQDKVQLSWYDSDLHLQVDKESFLSAKPYHEGAFGFAWAGVRATHGVNNGKVCFEVKITEELKWEDFSKYYDKHRRDPHKSFSKHKFDDEKKKSDEEVKNKDETTTTQQENGEKTENTGVNDVEMISVGTSETAESTEETTNSESTEEPKKSESTEEHKKSESTEEPKKGESTEESQESESAEETKKLEETEAQKIESEKQTGESEMQKDEQISEEQADADKAKESTEDKASESKELVEPLPTHLFRVGWSLLETGLQLGEDKYSYGFESSGRFVVNKQFEDYGIKFGVGDVISSFLNIDESGIHISYSVNGVSQSEAVSVPLSEVPENFALFPHVLSRNYAFELNLGSKEESWFAKPADHEEYLFLDKVENKIAGPIRPENRSDCEVILMCGLPASGKTHWVREYVQTNPDKRYTILGNTHLLEKMTVSGDALKSKYRGSWNILLEKLQKCINKLVEIAALRRRNYIIDQPNVYPSAQRRKLRPFEGFKRRAVVVVVGDEEQAKRQSLQEAEGGKDVPDTTILEMKANMSLPQKGDWIDEVEYAGVGEEEAKSLIQKYNSHARETIGIQRRFSHRDDRHRWQNRRNDYRGGNYRDRNYHNNRYDRGPPRQGNWHPQRPGGWNRDRRDNRGPPMGGSRDWRTRGNARDRGNRDSHSQGSNYNRNRNQQGRGHSGNWPSSWGQNQGSWGNQPWGGQGSWSQSSWSSQQSSQNQWKYGGGSGGYGSYSNWNYYGQYPQNWGQGQTHSGSSTAGANQYGQYSQQDWAQYAQQYAQQGQSTPGSTAVQSTPQK